MAGSPVLVYCIFCSVLLLNGKIFIHKMTSCKPTDLRALKGRSLAVRRQVSHELSLVQRLRPRYVCYASAFCDDGSCRPIAPCGLFRVRRCHWRESQDRAGPSVQPSPLKAFEKRTGPRQDVPTVPRSHQQPTPKPLSHVEVPLALSEVQTIRTRPQIIQSHQPDSSLAYCIHPGDPLFCTWCASLLDIVRPAFLDFLRRYITEHCICTVCGVIID